MITNTAVVIPIPVMKPRYFEDFLSSFAQVFALTVAERSFRWTFNSLFSLFIFFRRTSVSVMKYWVFTLSHGHLQPEIWKRIIIQYTNIRCGFQLFHNVLTSTDRFFSWPITTTVTNSGEIAMDVTMMFSACVWHTIVLKIYQRSWLTDSSAIVMIWLLTSDCGYSINSVVHYCLYMYCKTYNFPYSLIIWIFIVIDMKNIIQLYRLCLCTSIMYCWWYYSVWFKVYDKVCAPLLF